MSDPFTHFVLLLAAIAWSMWGTLIDIDLVPFAPNWRWWLFLVAAAGPVVWALWVHRGLRAARKRLFHRLGLPSCGCCS